MTAAQDLADELENGCSVEVVVSKLTRSPGQVHNLLDELRRRGRDDRAAEFVALLTKREVDARAEIEADLAALADPETNALLERMAVEEAEARRSVGLDELLAEDDDEYDWIVPGLFERGDRTIVTGGEGKGKSTLLRQMALRCASGLHPFTAERIQPLRVLFVDAENTRRQTRRKMRALREVAGPEYQEDLLRFEFRGEGLNLAATPDAEWLAERIEANQPDLLFIGALYKLIDGDSKEEPLAKAVAKTFDEIRTIYDIALIIEAHSPHGEGGSKAKRPIRPFGASLWLRWPEFGIHLADDGTLENWRGPRDERAWPAKLRRGMPWPWEVDQAAEVEPEPWSGPTRCMADVLDYLRRIAPVEKSPYKLEKEMGGYRRSTIEAALAHLALNRQIRRRPGARNAELYWYEEGFDALT